MKRLRWLCFLLTFSMEVRIRAESHGGDHGAPSAHSEAAPKKDDKAHAEHEASHASDSHHEDHGAAQDHKAPHKKVDRKGLPANAVMIPKSCVKTLQTPCTLHNPNRQAFFVQWHGREFVLGAYTVVSFESAQNFRLVKGGAWVKSNAKSFIQTVYGLVELLPDTWTWLRRTDEQIDIRTHRGLTLVQLKGDKKFYEIPAGFETTLKPVAHDATAKMQTPRPLDLKEHLLSLRNVVPDSEEYKEELARFFGDWKAAQKYATDFHSGLVQEELFAVKRAALRHAEVSSRLKVERLKYREMLMERATQ
jgi:hypothetical protein